MTTATSTRPSLREIVLDALNDAYYSRRANVEECRACTRQPAGVCPDHLDDSDLSRAYEDARRQIEGSIAGDAGEIASLIPAAEGGEGND
jgi:hypothetical protein